MFALLAVLLAACSGGSDAARDPADRPEDPGAAPSAIPAAPGEVRTRGVVTVLDDGDGPQLCLGAVAESWPPQCGGPPLLGWDWQQRLREPGQPGGAESPGYEQASGVRWGQYALAGRWDGESFTVTAAVPGAHHEPPREEEPVLPEPEVRLGDQELQRLADELLDRLPGALTAYVGDGRARVEVVYDDGTLQEWADRRHGVGVVVVVPALVDVPDGG